MTERLYYTDAYLDEFEATVVERADDGRRVYLDRTAFYPTSGGQPCDRGTLDRAHVLDVIDEGDRIAHVVDGPVVSGRLRGRVDWPHRFDHMQQHTGQHLLSAMFADLLGVPTVSVHIGDQRATLDLETTTLDAHAIRMAEARANEHVFENRPVHVSFEDAATATGLRKASERKGVLRIVTIEGIDRSACGGTHVRHTGAIGPISIRGTERVRDAMRVEFVCGGRATRCARDDLDIVTSVAALYSASRRDVADLAAASLERLHAAESAVRKLQSEVAADRARERYAATAPDVDGVRRVIERSPSGSIDDLRAFAQSWAALPKTLFVGAIDQPPVLLVASSADSGVDAGPLLKRALAAVGGRGGGSPRLAQGTVPHAALLDQVLASLR